MKFSSKMIQTNIHGMVYSEIYNYNIEKNIEFQDTGEMRIKSRQDWKKKECLISETLDKA